MVCARCVALEVAGIAERRSFRRLCESRLQGRFSNLHDSRVVTLSGAEGRSSSGAPRFQLHLICPGGRVSSLRAAGRHRTWSGRKGLREAALLQSLKVRVRDLFPLEPWRRHKLGQRHGGCLIGFGCSSSRNRFSQILALESWAWGWGLLSVPTTQMMRLEHTVLARGSSFRRRRA